MPNQRARRTKRRLDSSQVDPNESESSHANVVSRKIFEIKRAKKGTFSSSNSSDEEVEDETFRVEHRKGMRPTEGDSEDEEEGAVGADGSDDDEGDGSENEDANDIELPVINRPRYPFERAPTNYFGDGMPETVKRLRRENPYNEPKSAIDARFWTPFQQDFYTSVILKKSKITHEAQYVDWEHMVRKNDSIFDQVIAACAEKRIKHLMGFKHSWNREIIAQFYAAVYFGHYQNERAIFWMTEEERYHITFPAFVSQFRLGDDDINYPKLHDEGVLESKEMHFMYPRNCRGDWGKVKNLYTFYSILNRLFRKTLTPRDGNTSDVMLFQRNLMAAMRPGAPQFSVGDFIWQEIKNVSENP
ncbi:putative copia-like retroelement [Panicum miliaceum]|uniref:Copia-like retroelement n=1 Tax=Panicum miliaceum TaxID=4540 RepID=A0A3L6T1R5_PANMI|nr:putative copia-like retroelement [Panicum miliaceum]